MMDDGLLSFQSRLDLFANEADPILRPYDRFRTMSNVVRLDFEPATTKGEQGSKIKYTQHIRYGTSTLGLRKKLPGIAYLVSYHPT
jgi:hypothetical protein